LNDLASLKITIENISLQKSGKFEYLIFDGGSTDGTQNSIKEYEHQIGCFISEPDQGIYDAMNKGINKASGEWINFMNAGDVFFDKNVLEEISELDLGDVDIVYGDSIVDYGAFKVFKKAGKPEDLWKGMNIRHQAMFIRTDLMKKNHYDLRYPLGADYDFLFRANKENRRFLYIPKPIVIFDPYGITNSKILKVTREHHRISKKYVKYTPWMYLTYFSRLCYLSLINVTRIVLPPNTYLKLLKFINRKNLVSNS